MRDKLKLLVVDDDQDMLRLLHRMIESGLPDRFDIDTCCDSGKAIRQISTGCYDVILSDLMMPGIDGIEVLRIARARNSLTQVIMVTGALSHEALLASLECGATDYLLKPVKAPELIELLQHASERYERWQKALALTWAGRSASTSELHAGISAKS